MMRYFSGLLLALVLLLGMIGVAADDETDEIQAILEDVISQFSQADGAALVVQLTTPDGVWVAATGLADDDRPAVVADRFRIGSMSKTFVAIAALMLVDDGVFDLDDPAGDWLPDDVIDEIENLDAVSIRQLLNMRSGLEDYLGEEAFWQAVEANPYYAWTAPEVLEYAYGLPAVFEPDEDFYYTNTNYILLQLILEEASGLPLHSLLRERILEPLGMDDTYTQTSEELPGGFVASFGDLYGDGEIIRLSDINDGAGLGDGGLISNTADVTTFYEALFVERSLLSDEMMDELLDFQPVDDDSGYSFGLNSWSTEDGEAWGHGGGVLGFLSIGAYLPDEEIILVILIASDVISPEDVAFAVIDEVVD